MKLIKPDLINRWQWGRKPRLGACSMLAAASVLSAASAFAQVEKFDIDLNYRLLENALIELSKQTGAGVFAAGEKVKTIQVTPLSGNMSVEEALGKLLQGTGLKYDKNEDGSYVIQESPESSSPSSKEQTRRGVEEVYVSARRREESVQDVPIAITAFSAADMKAAGITNVGDMEGVVPGLNMSGGGNGLKKDSNPFVRGVGQRETKVTLDPAVGTYIDGIYLARTAGALLDTVGMERVEVLRGPQGTLFGKNVAGGAISFTTIKPHEELGGSLNVNVGNYGRSDVAGVLNVPFTDKLFGRFTLSSKNNDGYFTNVVDNTTWGEDNRVTGIGQLRWEPNDKTAFDLLAERTRIRESPRPSKCAIARPVTPEFIYLFEGDPGYNASFPPGTGLYNLVNAKPNPDYTYNPTPIRNIDLQKAGNQGYKLQNGEVKSFNEYCEDSHNLPDNKFASDFAEGNDLLQKGRYWVDTATLGLTGTWDFGDIGPLTNTQFKSITGWRKVEQIADEDLDATSQPYLLRIQDGFNETTQISQEFQFTGSALGDRLFFSTGLYYFHEETPQDTLIRTAGIAQGPAQGVSAGMIRTLALEPTRETLETDNDALAWYGQLDFSLTEQIELSFGLRYTNEERSSAYSKGYVQGPSMVSGNPIPGAGNLDWISTVTISDAYGLANIFDWRFYSADFPGCADTNGDGDYTGDECVSQDGVTGRPLGPAFGRKTESTKDSAWTPMASIKYHFADNLLDRLRFDSAMVYATYSKGFTSGGVTAGAVDSDENTSLIKIEDPLIFDPQFVDNYELGLKLQAWDQRIQANTAIFYTDYTDMQVTSTVNRAGIPIPFVDNVGKAVIQGFEGELTILPTSSWRILANVAYTDAELKEWDARQIVLNPLTGAPLNLYRETDRSDEPMPRVPRWQAYASTDYTFFLPDGGTITPSISARHMSEIYHGFDRGSFVYGKDKVTSSPITFVDARLAWVSGDGDTDIALWVKNVTDKQSYMVGAIPLVDTTGTIGQVHANPRTFGLSITRRFGGE